MGPPPFSVWLSRDGQPRTVGMTLVGMTRLLLLLVVAASLWAGIALDRAGWTYRKQLWQFQGAATGFVAGFLLGRSRLI